MLSDYDRKRQQASTLLIQILGHLVKTYPSMRFGQLMSNAGFVESSKTVSKTSAGYDVSWQNEWHLEPWDLLQRVIERCADIELGLPVGIEVLYADLKNLKGK